ncbi:MAG: sulfotransferase family protein [Gammaproteobacteria bacterium]|nr:sulfotransferase family protein [Gammaproteobacteria bacterium]
MFADAGRSLVPSRLDAARLRPEPRCGAPHRVQRPVHRDPHAADPARAGHRHAGAWRRPLSPLRRRRARGRGPRPPSRGAAARTRADSPRDDERRRLVIVSHRHRFIFFAVPRTGTHAIRTALRGCLGPDDWQQQSLTEQVRLPVPALARIGHGHVTLRQARAHLPEAICRDYFKFACVRNPYERFVSACAMLNRRNPGYAGNERAFMKRALGVRRFRERALVRPQADMLVDERGALGMDFVGRYETLQQSFDEACRRLGIAAPSLSHGNATEHGPWMDYYDDDLLRVVTEFYRRDFDALAYDRAGALSCA